MTLKPYTAKGMQRLAAAVRCGFRAPWLSSGALKFAASPSLRVTPTRLCMRGVATSWDKLEVQDYGNVKYWNNRYIDQGEESSYDWYRSFHDLQHLLHEYVPKNSRVLMAGCGNADLSEDMVFDGYKDIVNIDISSVVIKLMRQRHEHIPQLTYMTLDARNLSVFGDDSFDAVIDKGLMDSLLCSSEGVVEAMIMLEEVSRVLKPGGVFMLVTYGEPSLRMQHLKDPAFNWDVVLHILPKDAVPAEYAGAIRMDDNWECDEFLLELSNPDLHFAYICTKDNAKQDGSLTSDEL